MVDLSIVMLVHQRVSAIFLWFSYSFPMIFPFSYGFPMVFTSNRHFSSRSFRLLRAWQAKARLGNVSIHVHIQSHPPGRSARLRGKSWQGSVRESCHKSHIIDIKITKCVFDKMYNVYTCTHTYTYLIIFNYYIYIYICVCVCMYVYIYICVCVYTHDVHIQVHWEKELQTLIHPSSY